MTTRCTWDIVQDAALLEQLQQGKTIIHSVKTLIAYLCISRGEDEGGDLSRLAQNRRVERRLRKVQLHDLQEDLKTLFTITAGELVEPASSGS